MNTLEKTKEIKQSENKNHLKIIGYIIGIVLFILIMVLVLFRYSNSFKCHYLSISWGGGLCTREEIKQWGLPIFTNTEGIIGHLTVENAVLKDIPKNITISYKTYEMDSENNYLIKDGDYVQREAFCFCEIASSVYKEKITPYGIVKYLDLEMRDTGAISVYPTEFFYEKIIWVEKDGIIYVIYGSEFSVGVPTAPGIDSLNVNSEGNILYFTAYGYEGSEFIVYDLKNKEDISGRFEFAGAPNGSDGIPQAFAISSDGKSFAYAELIEVGDNFDQAIQIVYIPKFGEKVVLRGYNYTDYKVKYIDKYTVFPTVYPRINSFAFSKEDYLDYTIEAIGVPGDPEYPQKEVVLNTEPVSLKLPPVVTIN